MADQQGRGAYQKPNDGIDERLLLLRRVTKKTTGGNYSTYSALVAVGDRNGRVGIGLGSGLEVPQSIKKATTYARKHMIVVPRYHGSIPHEVMLSYKAAKILIKPAPEGTGLKVGSVVRVLLDLAGVYNASGKIIGTRNQIMNTYAAMKAFSMLKARPERVITKSKETKENEAAKTEKPAKTVKKTAKVEKK